MGRYIRYWYTYRTVVAVLLALVLSGSMFWLYNQQQSCDEDSFDPSCHVNISVHPEDRLVNLSAPDKSIVIVGLDNKSVQDLKSYPIPRSRYGEALRNLQKAGAAVVAFDIGFPDPREENSDLFFAKALAESTIPVVLSYGGDNTLVEDGKLVQTGPNTNPRGIDQIPLRIFRCADTTTTSNLDAPCQKPLPNVILASTDIRADADGVVRRMPMFVEPACLADGACSTPTINPLSFAAYRAFSLGKDFQTGPTLDESGGTANFGTAWTQPLELDGSGAALINFSGAADNFKSNNQYISFSDVARNQIPMDLNGKIVLIGAYYLTGFQDEQLVTTSAGSNGRKMPRRRDPRQRDPDVPAGGATPGQPVQIPHQGIASAALCLDAFAGVVDGNRRGAGFSFGRLAGHWRRACRLHFRHGVSRDQQQLRSRPFPSLAGHRAHLLGRDRLSLPV